MQNIVTLGEINDALKIAAVTAAQLADMGFAALANKPICEGLPPEESRRLRNAKLYPAESIGQIRVALAKRLAAPAPAQTCQTTASVSNATSHTAPAAVAATASPTFMTADQGRDWAWNKVREYVGTEGWTVMDSVNFHGFFLYGWNYRGQYELQRSAATAAVKQELMTATVAVGERAAFEAWAKSEDMSIGTDCDGYIHSNTAAASCAWQARAALAATPAAAAQVVLPEPDFQLKWSASAGRYSFSKPITGDADCYTADTVRTLLAGASAPAAQAVEPTDAELIALNAGECYFGESPSKYPELGHGTQYHAGAPGVLGFARAALALRSDPAAYSQKFQQRVQPWMMTCFGPEISSDHIERNHRFLEESLELVQSLGCTASEAHQLVDYVFGRPAGEPAQEAGGVMVTLAALCLASGLDMHACGETELARIWTKVEAIRAKQAAKPKHSPLPMHAPQAQADARDADTFEQRMSDWQHADALDAERYRWLRSRDLETISQGGVFAGMTPQNIILNEEDLDEAVDAAIAAQTAQQGGDKQ